MDVKDFLGNTLKEKDQIVWPNRQGSTLWMNKGHVRNIGTDENNVPVLIVDRFQGDGIATKKVEIYRTNRVVALGRWDNFQPMKEPCELRETWLDRVMAWIRK